MSEFFDDGIRQFTRIDDTGMIKLVDHHDIILARKRGNDAEIRLIACRKHEGAIFPEKRRKLFLKLHVNVKRAV
jgi:hypothetical protein